MCFRSSCAFVLASELRGIKKNILSFRGFVQYIKTNFVFQMFMLHIKQSLKSTAWKESYQIDLYRI